MDEKVIALIKDLEGCLRDLQCLVEGEHGVADEHIENIVSITERASDYFTARQLGDNVRRFRDRRSGSIVVTGNMSKGSVLNTGTIVGDWTKGKQ